MKVGTNRFVPLARSCIEVVQGHRHDLGYNPYKEGFCKDGQHLRPSDPAYEQVLDALAMVARHTPGPLLEPLLEWRTKYS